ncbi:PhoB family transcriptional regulator [Aerococcus urinaehominis]|uniref:PhoB family transcriptional regulator n=1 Tax=Aerococcus urinaehominis TaxID=128944 RepID=A0A109RGW4_9LACT|nr:response regulator transcription factor [Aerococcus urinaehominis]AMB99351.1 PhoB family transcriptional regulator [Aerococcus urinaehominis]SDM58093.1 DNA-binding response regulator, OmpR family, contains REC and winged-helix (wHTH) domain [Aerococcus urinaehominis]
MKILVVDDDKEIVELLTIYASNEGYEVVQAFDGEEALKKIVEHPDINLIILDIMMPGKDGVTVVKELRSRDVATPIILLSAKSTDMDKITGLTTGADDYVTKPFNPLEVMARVKSLLRRANMETDVNSDLIEVGPLIIEKNSHEVKTIEGVEIQLTALEFGILYLLASHPNTVFSADEIFERVWQQESVVSAKTVMVHVSHLRDKLEAATGGDKVISTVWGVGYKISAPSK